jgi:hypothetical protein
VHGGRRGVPAKEGQLRPLLTAGRPPDGLLARVKASREAILIRLADLMDFGDLGEPPPLPDGERRGRDRRG